MAPMINGFICGTREQVGAKTFTVPGTTVKVVLRADVAPLLLEFARWWHENVEPIDTAPIDDWGYAARSVRASTSPSFHWAGIAMDINATRHPLGKVGTVPAAKRAAITAKAASLGLRWGGNYTGRKDEMHAEVIVALARALELVAALQRPVTVPTYPVTPGAPSAPTAPTAWPTIRRGSKGSAVGTMQRFLGLVADGDFGAKTEAAVRHYQQMRGLAADGVAGPATWRATGL